jgi:uroporphyrinogen-III synthase
VNRLLYDFGLLITRPEVQARKLAHALRNAGGVPLLYPTIEIAEVENPAPALAVINALDQFDWAIFISANAVEKAFAMIGQRVWPATLQTAAVGAATATALRAKGLTQVISPTDRADSEALLALAPMQTVAGKRIVIFRGAGGRETLAHTLSDRGAQVTYCECYRRLLPSYSPNQLDSWLAQKKIDAISVMSGESLLNLLSLARDRSATLKTIPLIVHHSRVVELASAHGFAHINLCPPDDDALITVLESLSLAKLAQTR